jgi:enoyl-CoA hydratase/carnithine racemase
MVGDNNRDDNRDDSRDGVLKVSVADGLARLSINRPDAMNTLNGELMAALVAAFADLSGRSDVRVVLLTAEGERAFSAGADRNESRIHKAVSLEESLAAQPGIFDLMRRCRQVIVAGVNGWAVGGGAQLALFADLVFASAGARFKLPQVSLGIIPPYATTALMARKIGAGNTMRMLLLGEVLGADEAQTAGLVQEVLADPARLEERLEEVAALLLELPPASLLMAKNAVTFGLDATLDAAAEADRFRDYALKKHKEQG